MLCHDFWDVTRMDSPLGPLIQATWLDQEGSRRIQENEYQATKEVCETELTGVVYGVARDMQSRDDLVNHPFTKDVGYVDEPKSSIQGFEHLRVHVGGELGGGMYYLRPNIKHGEFSDDEDKVICVLFVSIGSRWSLMATQLPVKMDNAIKNYWNTKLKKKMMNILITLPELRKPHQHLQCFTSSTNCIYPSQSIFQNSNINVNVPLSSSISSSPSYLYNTNTSSYHDQILSIPSSPRINDANRQHLVLQSQDHGFLGLVSTETYHSTHVFFGGDQASCNSNSDGSSYYEYRSTVGVYDQHRNNLSDSYKEFGVLRSSSR
uniref:HTH myb-type domain-containing protein n=1 Tax=Lactuca sativa TaxID=4236 RepID=A0A9R1VQ22_LACSA|nr:hypothetical protein LSAT_V11C500255130 [Lactuca sativa]